MHIDRLIRLQVLSDHLDNLQAFCHLRYAMDQILRVFLQVLRE